MELFSRDPAKGLFVLDAVWCDNELQVRIGRTRVLWFEYWKGSCVPFTISREASCWGFDWRQFGFKYERGTCSTRLDWFFLGEASITPEQLSDAANIVQSYRPQSPQERDSYRREMEGIHLRYTLRLEEPPSAPPLTLC